MFVLILCMFKVGSCFIEKCLSDNHIQHVKLHSYDIDEQKLYPIHQITHIITIKRNPKDLWKSAFFEDIDKIEHYPYAFGTSEEVEAATIDQLINHYCAQDWKRYRWLNFDYYKGWIEKFKAIGKPILILNCDNLSDQVAKKLPKFFDMNMKLNLKPSHVGKDNTFGKKYQEFKHRCK